MNELATKTFEAALRDLGAPMLRLEQVVKAYHLAFPEDAMRPDMRERLHGAIAELCRSGVITIPDGGCSACQASELPTVIEMSASANFIQASPGRLS